MPRLIGAGIFLLFIAAALCSCATGDAVQAEEYFSLGMAYFELGKYEEAERWLNRARSADKTMTASDYNLGRIAFETGRYAEAAGFFERILNRDPQNIMALRGASYSRIKNGDLDKAELLYNRVVAMVPESIDDGFNYALVLYAVHKYDECEEVLLRYPLALEDNANSILLLARAQKAQEKIESIDSYDKWLSVHSGVANPQALYEYAQLLEAAGFYARALELYREAYQALSGDTEQLKRSQLLFDEGRLLLIADPENSDGITKIKEASTGGFSDTEALEILMSDERIIESNREEIRSLLHDLVYGAAAEP